MSEGRSQPSERDRQLELVIAEFLRSVEAGQPIDQPSLVQQHPDLADELQSFFANRAALERIAEPLKGAAYDPTLGMTASDEANDTTRVRYFGDYELLEEIARGGMGVVFKARQVSLNRVVAVKMILAGTLADESAVRRFRQEAEAAANLDHPHIVPVFEVGEHEGQQYFSMGFIEGQSLAAKLASGPLAPREAAELMEPVARAVQYAHERGVIHRDLKPANVLLDQQGRPRVTDFGLAKLTTREQSLTDTGQALGTPGYMPPEQVDGKPVGPQADVYGLGAILYALLTGRPPFQAATLMDTLQQVKHAEPVAPRQLNPSVPRDLDTIVRKCLEKWPDWRYATAQELADELARFLAGEPIEARRPGLVEQGVRWYGKQRRSVALAVGAVAATLALTLLGIGGWFWYQDWRLGRVMLKTDRPPIIAELLDDRDELAAPTFTVPTQEPIALPADEYRVRLSQPGRFSQSYQLSVERGLFPAEYSLNLDDQLLASTDGSTSVHLERDYALVTRQGRVDVVLLDAKGLRRSSWPSGGETWSLDLDKPADNMQLANAPGLRWPWSENANYPELDHTIFYPQVVRDAPDLDGDGIEDVIVAARHQAWILAASGRDGDILWLAARGADVTAVDPQRAISYANRNPSAAIGAPLVVGDLNGDGVLDLLATFADERGVRPQETSASPVTGPRRWLECVSGKSGLPLWQFDFEPAWFALPAGVEIPVEARWLVNVHGHGSGGGSYSDSRGEVSRDMGGEQASGEAHFAPCPPTMINWQGVSIAVSVAGTRAIGLDVATGQPAWGPIDLGLPAVRAPQVADLDGDGQAELLVVQMMPAKAAAGGTPSTSVRQELKVSAWSLAGNSRAIWEHTIHAERRLPWRMRSPTDAWPVIEDLDGDGRREVILPNATWDAKRYRWSKEIEVIDGASGQSRWRRALKMMDPQIDDFLAGPDINGDGIREVFAATLVGNRYDLYVDALSGQDGQTLCWGSRRIGRSSFIEQLSWWHPTEDGWPQLLVQTVPEHKGETSSTMSAFSAGRGKYTALAAEVDDFRLADGDGDGLLDLFALKYARPDDPSGGGQLQAFRGAANERWRRMGGKWQAGGDYDGDGQTDLVAIFPSGAPEIAAVSGDDGRKLWRTKLNLASTSWQPWAQPASIDLNGDEVSDIIVYHGPTGGGASGARRQFPVLAVSGRNGAILWSVEMQYANLEGVLFVEARDLENDGSPEIIFSTFTDWNFDRGGTISASSSWVQHWLAVVDGRTGKFRWRQPLSVAYGSPSAPASHTDETHLADMRPAFVDLNRDGVTDIVMPAEVSDSPGSFELRACSGQDGLALWRRPLALPNDRQTSPPADLRGLWQNAVTPTVADLDGDDRLELLGLEYFFVASPTRNQQRRVRLFALDAASGTPAWTWECDVEPSVGQAGTDPLFQAAKPRPLILARQAGKPLVAICLWGDFYNQPGRIVVLDHAGKLVAELPLTTKREFKPWVHDINGDGADELLVLDDGQLRAYQISPIDEKYEFASMWDWPIPASQSYRLIEILPATFRDPATAVVQAGTTLYGVSATTGQPIWINTGPQPRSAAGSPVSTSVELLPSSNQHEPPAAVFQWTDQFATCRIARRMTETPPLAEASAALRSSADESRSQISVADPRYLRKPSYVGDLWSQEVDRRRSAAMIVWQMVLATFLWVLPVGTLVKMTIQRQWSLRMFLLLPVLVGMMLILLTAPLPSVLQPPAIDSALRRLQDALVGVPVIVFLYVLIQHARNLRWRRLLGWSAAIVVIACLMVMTTLLLETRHLAPGERYVFADDWDILLAYSFFGASWLATAIAAMMSAIHWFRPHKVMPPTPLLENQP